MNGDKRKFEDLQSVNEITDPQKNKKRFHEDGRFLVEEGKSCIYRVAFPDRTPHPDATPPRFSGPHAKEFPFKLDIFQTVSIACLEAGDSVLVSAHTSAGKTVVAQYACAIALRDNTRMIYTSPLKALSNQKYRELRDDFADVGLLTGDVTINPDASCLVLTTEVFRSMLYRNDSTIQEVALVVFDEVHYLRDKERGVVWEECLILMPKHVQAIFLSATIPNAMQFATWFATIHEAKCHIVYTETRPVPLEHYLFPVGSDRMYMVLDENGRLEEQNFKQACSEITGKSMADQLRKRTDRQSTEDETDIFKLVKLILRSGLEPVIVFAFSKRMCEQLALQLIVMDINNDEEKELVEMIVRNALDALSDHDRRLPQVQHILPMLRRGIGVHHSGLLPIVKEITEILFQEGLVKVLFATETFSTGLNMPAKTVVFAGVQKYDAGGFRAMTSGEYIQMSGRAGRRGIDEKGIVITAADKSVDAGKLREILKGTPQPLLSAFRLNIGMVLEILKMDSGDAETLIRKSFRQFICQESVSEVESKLQEIQKEMEGVEVDETDQIVAAFVGATLEHERLWQRVQAVVSKPENCLPFLNPGRLVSISAPVMDVETEDGVEGFLAKSKQRWGVVVNFKKEKKTALSTATYIVDIFVNFSRGDINHEWLPLDDEDGIPSVVGFPLSSLSAFSSIRMHLPQDLKSFSSRTTAMHQLREVVRRLKKEHGKIPLLDPTQDIKIKKEILSRKVLKALKKREKEIEQNEISSLPDSGSRLEKHFRQKELNMRIGQLHEEIEAANDVILKKELRHMLKLLVKMDYIDETGLILKKGHTATKFRTADALLLTELVYNGRINNLTPQQLAAAVSCIIQPEGNLKDVKVSADLAEVYKSVSTTAGEIAKRSLDCKVIQKAQDYTRQFTPHFLEALHAWSNGASFAEVIRLSDVYEGSAVRMIRQVHRVLEELETAVQLTGQTELQENLHLAQESIKRDVIFATSLYL